MIKVVVRFDASAYNRWVSYHTYINLIRGDRVSYLEVKDAETLAWLINTFANNVRVGSFGYEAEVSDSVALAIWYLTYVRSPEREELAEIARTGTTKIHKFLAELGLEEYAKPDPFAPLPERTGKAKYAIDFKSLPKVTFTLLKRGFPSVSFKYDEVNAAFIKRVLDGETSEEEVAMLTGISLLQEKSQIKYMRLLSTGNLTLEVLAKALYRSASSCKYGDFWKDIVEWLELNGFERYASEVVVKKTLCA